MKSLEKYCAFNWYFNNIFVFRYWYFNFNVRFYNVVAVAILVCLTCLNIGWILRIV